MKNSIFIILLFLLQLSCSNNTSEPAISQLEYNFYSTVMDSLFSTEKSIILRDSLVIPYNDELTGPTIFADSIATKSKIDKTKFSNSNRIELISYEKLIEVSKKHDSGMWESFFQEYPNSIGWLSLSTISFNEDSSEASFFILYGCGDYCGGEKEIIFEQVESSWKLAYINQIGEL